MLDAAEDRRIEFNVADFLRCLKAVLRKVEYLVVYRRHGRDHEEPCGTLTLDQASTFADADDDETDLSALAARADGDDGDEDDGDEDDGDEDDGDEDASPALRTLMGAWAWVRATVLGNTDEGEKALFRVRAVGAKGHEKLFSRNLTVNREEKAEPPVPTLAPVPTPPPPVAVRAAAVDTDMPALGTLSLADLENADPLFVRLIAPFSELGRQYNHFGQMVLGALGRAQKVSDAQLDQLLNLLALSRSETSEVLAQLLKLSHTRLKAESADESRKALSAQGERQAAALERLVGEIGSTARFVFSNRNLSPAQMRLLEVLAADDELMAALSDEDVLAFLHDPDERQGLVEVLRGASALRRSARARAPERPSADEREAPATPDPASPAPGASQAA